MQKAEFIIELDREHDEIDSEAFHRKFFRAEIADFYRGSHTYT